MQEIDKKLTEQYETISIRYEEILQIIELLHKNLMSILSHNSDPRGRMALAELLQSYANLQRTALDLNKHKTDILTKSVELIRKIKEIEVINNTDFDIFKIQKILSAAGLLTMNESIEQNIQE